MLPAFCPSKCTAFVPHRAAQVLKYGAMSANIITEEPIDMVLHESYPNRWARNQK
jgi:hypothetical protein